jgi:NTE family protein
VVDAEEAVVDPGAAPPAAADPGLCLCLSGGGFRATLFHLGVILRLNELGVLARLSTITSVSGGSILNGVLATRWSRLNLGTDGTYTNIEEEIAQPTRDFCSKDLRTPVLLGTRINPMNWGVLIRDWFSVSANFLAKEYECLYGCRLSELPEPSSHVPRFVFCATSIHSGVCWHFHGGPRASMGDYYAGYYDASEVRLSDAVAASSAFPPGFSALRLKLPDGDDASRVDPFGEQRDVSAKRGDQKHSSGGNSVLLTDGGVYDNLAVEPVWRTYNALLVSDAGNLFESIPKSGQALITRLKRVVDISMEQVAGVRKRWLVNEFIGTRRTGAIWTLHTRLEDFPLRNLPGYGIDARRLLHQVRTDLNAFSEGEIACLVNHGYTLANAALQSHAISLCPNPSAPFRWPHDDWSDDGKLKSSLIGSNQRRILRDVIRYLTWQTPRFRP